jgi:predicted ferric reductase
VSSHDIWYLDRASGLTAYGLLWISVVWGLFSSLRLARSWPGGGIAFDLHEHASLLALGFALLHAILLLAERQFGLSLFELLVPFAPARHALPLGLGQIALALLGVVTVSHYLRRRIGQRAWRLLHYASFAVFLLALVHALWAGTDSTSVGMRLFYAVTGSSVLFLTIYRLLSAFDARARSYTSNATPPSPTRRLTSENSVASK